MLRLLLPGIRIKRWILVAVTGMVLFAAGFSLAADPWWLQVRIYEAWERLTTHSFPERLPVIIGILLIVFGTSAVIYGVRTIIRAFTFVANPNLTRQQLVKALLEWHYPAPKLKIVGIGGGTGLSTLLRGLKEYPVDLKAIVTVSDDGGSSGRLRNGMDMPPPGDIRNCLVALAEAEPLMEKLFQYRFSESGTELDGHSLGNLMIAGLRQISGDFCLAIKEVSRVLAIRGRVLPSANRALVLHARMDDGTVAVGETAITASKGTINSIWIDPPDVQPLPEVLQAIADADVVIVGPGSVYSSLVPNLLIPGMARALAESQAIKFFICNVMTKPGESDHFNASRHLEAVLEHLPCENPFHYAIVNSLPPPSDVMTLYAEKGQSFVELDLERFKALGTLPVTGELLAITPLARHEPAKLARCILERVAEDTNLPEVLKRR